MTKVYSDERDCRVNEGGEGLGYAPQLTDDHTQQILASNGVCPYDV